MAMTLPAVSADRLLWLAYVGGILVALVAAYVFAGSLAIWSKALFAGARVSLGTVMGMKFRGENPARWVKCHVAARRGGVGDTDIERLRAFARRGGSPESLVAQAVRSREAGLEVAIADLESLHAHGGDVDVVIDALIRARSLGLKVSFRQMTAHHLAGGSADTLIRRMVDEPGMDAVSASRAELIARAGLSTSRHVQR